MIVLKHDSTQRAKDFLQKFKKRNSGWIRVHLLIPDGYDIEQNELDKLKEMGVSVWNSREETIDE